MQPNSDDLSTSEISGSTFVPFPEQRDLIAELVRFDGHLVPIPRLASVLGNQSFVAVRKLEGASKSELSYMSIDIYAEQVDRYLPVARSTFTIAKSGVEISGYVPSQFLPLLAGAQEDQFLWGQSHGLRVAEIDVLGYAEWGSIVRSRGGEKTA